SSFRAIFTTSNAIYKNFLPKTEVVKRKALEMMQTYTVGVEKLKIDMAYYEVLERDDREAFAKINYITKQPLIVLDIGGALLWNLNSSFLIVSRKILKILLTYGSCFSNDIHAV
ncbi:16404_t:CDS:2, partial [Funneliformis caledonium]